MIIIVYVQFQVFSIALLQNKRPLPSQALIIQFDVKRCVLCISNEVDIEIAQISQNKFYIVILSDHY